MNVYLESNFVIELALLQEQHASCDALLALGEAGRVRLVIPAFSLAEPYQTLGRRHGDRVRTKVELDSHLRLLARTRDYSERLSGFEAVTKLLIDSQDVEGKRLEDVQVRLLRNAEIIVLDRAILESALRCQENYGLSPTDALVCASVLEHLQRASPTESCFLNRDTDFDDPDLVEALERQGCKLLRSFDAGYNYAARDRLIRFPEPPESL